MFNWPGLNVPLTWESERTGIENNWYALTGRVVAVKVEADGDLHIAIQDAIGDNPGLVVCGEPAGPQRCEISPENIQFCAATRFCFRRQPLPRVLFGDAFSGTRFLGEEDSDSWFRDARAVAHCVPHVGSLLIKRGEFFVLRSSHEPVKKEEQKSTYRLPPVRGIK